MKKLKGIIFDLDDTLYDCSGTLTKQARMRAAEQMIKDGLAIDKESAYKKQVDYFRRLGPRCDVFNKIAEEFNIKQPSFIENALKAYNSDDVGDIRPFPDAINVITQLRKKYKIILITSGIFSRQKKKIEVLGLDDIFDEIIINDIEKDFTKENDFLEIIKKTGLKPEEFVSVGDRINSEIRIGNRLGMNTVQMLHGRYQEMKPKNDLEEPDYKINSLSELPFIIHAIEMRKPPKIVCIGGGTGLSRILEGLKKYTTDITSVVAVTDAGRSSGIIREEMKILPPADVKQSLIALSERSEDVRDILKYRFEGNGRLGDMSFGNLFIAALTKITGSFDEAVKKAGDILHIRGKVLPVTLNDCHICAELEDGTIVKKDYNIYKRDNKSRIKKVFIEPESNALPEALEEIRKADIITIGPGSLYTSVIADLLMKGMKDALKERKGKLVYISNLVTQKGQTENFTLKDHIDEIEKYIGKEVIDYVIINSKKPDEKIIRMYRENGLDLVSDDLEKDSHYKIIYEDILREMSEIPDKGKHDLSMIIHDPDKVSLSVLRIINEKDNNLRNFI